MKVDEGILAEWRAKYLKYLIQTETFFKPQQRKANEGVRISHLDPETGMNSRVSPRYQHYDAGNEGSRSRGPG